jgi:ABC-type iron transport system FetAB ATPase subunit
MNRSDFEKQFRALEKEINQKVYTRDTLVKTIADKKSELESDIAEKAHLNKASIFFKSKAQDTRETYIQTINYHLSMLVKRMYGDDYEFGFLYNEKAQEKGEKIGFNLYPTITNSVNGKRVTTYSMDSRGGGILETISVFLRWVFVRLDGYNGPLILDESWSAVSADDKMEMLIEFIKQYIVETDSQLIFVTHRAENFGKIADKIFLVQKENGVAKSSEITYAEIVEKQLSFVDKNEN